MVDRNGENAICPKCGALISLCDSICSDRAGGTSSDDAHSSGASGNPPAGIFSNGFPVPETQPDVLSVEELVKRLKDSGVSRTDDELRFLIEKLNYRTIRKYCRVIERRVSKSALSAGNIQVFSYFDRSLQAVLLQGIAVVELQFRAVYGRIMAETLGPFAHHDSENFKNTEHYEKFVEDYGRELSYKLSSRSSVSLDDYSKYQDVPIWQAVEILGLGTLSKLYRNTKDRSVRRGVADSFGVNYERLASWMRTICEVRNRCAHFEDVCVTPITCRPKRIEGLNAPNDGAFYVVAIINRLIEGGIDEIRDGVSRIQALKFLHNLELLASEVPPEVFLAAGFPLNWAKQLTTVSLHARTLYEQFIDETGALRSPVNKNAVKAII